MPLVTQRSLARSWASKFLGCCFLATASYADTTYKGLCRLEGGEQIPCAVALFSNYDFNVLLDVATASEGDLLCEDSATPSPRNNKMALAVARGGCAFETKAKNAASLGYRALLIANMQDDGEPFPMGASDPSYVCPIPVLMVPGKSLSSLSINSSIRLFFEASSSSRTTGSRAASEQGARHLLLAIAKHFLLPATVLLLVALAAGLPTSLASSWSGLAAPAAYVLIALVSLSLRLGTFRVLVRGELRDEFNHQETDERIFSSLVQAVSIDWQDYSLRDKPIVDALRLARSNYGDALFIHPPVFVYASALLQGLTGLALPWVPLLCSAFIMAAIPLLTTFSGLSSALSLAGTPPWALELLALITYCLCPLSHFCSQKFWVDNMLAAAVVAASTLHVWLCGNEAGAGAGVGAGVGAGEERVEPSRRRGWGGELRALCSGLFFGAAVLGCKVTGLALLPFLLAWQLLVVLSPSDQAGDAARDEGGLTAGASVAGGAGGADGAGGRGQRTASRPRGARARSTSKRTASSSSNSSSSGIKRSQARDSDDAESDSPRLLLDAIRFTFMRRWLPFLLGAFLAHAPWLWLYRLRTGRLLPNAWPSQEMLANAPFVRRIVERPPWWYLSCLVRLIPLQAAGLLCASVWALQAAWAGLQRLIRGNSNEAHPLRKAPNSLFLLTVRVRCATMLLWPVGFLGGLTLLSLLGAGAQGRFLLPALPAACILASVAVLSPIYLVHHAPAPAPASAPALASASASAAGALAVLLLAVSAMHCLFYGVLFAPLYADAEADVFDWLDSSLKHAYHPLSSKSTAEEAFEWLKHFGIELN